MTGWSHLLPHENCKRFLERPDPIVPVQPHSLIALCFRAVAKLASAKVICHGQNVIVLKCLKRSSWTELPPKRGCSICCVDVAHRITNTETMLFESFESFEKQSVNIGYDH